MGLETRDYYHDEGGPSGLRLPPITSWVKVFLIYYSAAFLFEFLLKNAVSREALEGFHAFFGLNLSRVWSAPYFYFYQFVTHLFVPVYNFWSLILTLIAFYFIGGLLEISVGAKRFFQLFLFSGIFAGVLYCIFTLGQGAALILGPAAGILGLLAAAAVLYPRMTILLAFVIPVPMWVVAAILTAMFLFHSVEGSTNALHQLFGLAGGALYAWNYKMPVSLTTRYGFKNIRVRMQKRRREKEYQQDQSLRQEMDRILAKINREGIGALTAHEKKTLDIASRRFRNGQN